MADKTAFAVEQILKGLPEEDRRLRRLVTAKAGSELAEAERADVSWISTESVDRDKEVVLAKGMDDSQFAGNPLVTMNHRYDQPAVARSVWRKRMREGGLVGIKAKTHYPPRPDAWTAACWPPDDAFSLVKAGLLNGKSIGFIALKSHVPSGRELAARGAEGGKIARIIDEWLLLEYACTVLPTNQDALVAAVFKASATIPFTAWSEVMSGVRRTVHGIYVDAVIKQAVEAAAFRLRGGV
jgi:hypothetical protein